MAFVLYIGKVEMAKILKRVLGYFFLSLPLIVVVVIGFGVGWSAFLKILVAGAAAMVLVLGCACIGHYLVTSGRKPEEKKNE